MSINDLKRTFEKEKSLTRLFLMIMLREKQNN